MKRRQFLNQGIKAGVLAAGAPMIFTSLNKAYGANNYDLVAIKGGEPGEMFDKGIASLGGMKKFVSQGQKVVVKPNIGWDTSPERAANTNPQLVSRIVEHCLNAGAKEVYVFDNTCDNWTRCYSNSGIESAVKTAGGKVVPGNSESYYQEVSIQGTSMIKSAKVHELILESDVFINVPVLKHHSSARLTITMKNLMGIVWDRRFWHKNDLHQCIAEFASYRKPDLNVVDCYNVMKRNGPRGVSTADLVPMKAQIISTDPVAADAAASMMLGFKPAEIPYIKTAHELNVGNMNLDNLSINRVKM